jgi:hypothetical protein
MLSACSAMHGLSGKLDSCNKGSHSGSYESSDIIAPCRSYVNRCLVGTNHLRLQSRKSTDQETRVQQMARQKMVTFNFIAVYLITESPTCGRKVNLYYPAHNSLLAQPVLTQFNPVHTFASYLTNFTD